MEKGVCQVNLGFIYSSEKNAHGGSFKQPDGSFEQPVYTVPSVDDGEAEEEA